MKKRSILVTVLAVVLACVISVGGTFAYLTAKDDKVTNSFEFAGMKVTLKEDPPKDEDLPGEVTTETDPNGKGNKYKDIEPGQTLPKKPEVKPETDVPAYLFIKVSGASADVKPCNAKGETTTNPITTDYGWIAVGTIDKNFNGVYCKLVDKTSTDFITVFDHVKVSETADGTKIPSSIVIDVYEIQQSSFVAEGKEASDDTCIAAAYAQVPQPFNPAGPAAKSETETPAA